jgi:cytochrome c peroxidase
MSRIVYILIAPFLLSSCNEEELEPVTDLQQIPSWFPSMDIPQENELTQARIDLGRKLFYDKRLSRDETVSCGNCHKPELAFTDGIPVSVGIDDRIGLRNTPTLANIGYTDVMFMDGGVQTLELQAQSPIFTAHEMDFTIAAFLQRISTDETYADMFQAAYGMEPNAFGISRSIAAFERTFISGYSRFDAFEYQNDTQALSDSEKRGRELFLSDRASCADCHVPPLFTNFEFENIGLYTTYSDSGRARITQFSTDNGKFKVPTLRNVSVTAPYMHDGSFSSLEQVVGHFNVGGVGHANQNPLVRPLNLTQQEIDDLVAFLSALTDERFLSNVSLTDPGN